MAHRSVGVAAVVIPAVLAAGAVLLLDRTADSAPPSSDAQLSRLARRAESLSALQSVLTPLQLRPARGRAPRADLGARVRPARPVRLSIPGARVESPVLPARVKRGAIQIPSVGKAGWYAGGPRPGEPGRAVIIGHLDRLHGPGLFARVPRLARGALVTVTDARREVHRYRVVGAGQARKNRFPRDQVLGYSARPVLVLVTCGGPFRPGSGYRDNVLVFARGA